MSEQLALQFTESLPRKPWATDDLTYGLRVQPLAGAIQRRYIQHNQPALVCWMVFDIDRPAGALAWEDAGLPAPFWVATNPANGHAHICYGLSAPVCRSDAAKAAPLRLTAAIEAALCDRLQADVGYAGLVCKNPLHKHWRVEWFGGGPYELGYLAEWCGDLKRYSDRRRLLLPCRWCRDAKMVMCFHLPIGGPSHASHHPSISLCSCSSVRSRRTCLRGRVRHR